MNRHVAAAFSAVAIVLLAVAAGRSFGLGTLAMLLLVASGLALSAYGLPGRWTWAGPALTAAGLAFAHPRDPALAALGGIAVALSLAKIDLSRNALVPTVVVVAIAAGLAVGLPRAMRPGIDAITPAALALGAGACLAAGLAVWWARTPTTADATDLPGGLSP